MKFAICAHCGNVVEFVHDAGVSLSCCGEKMKVLTPNTTDAATEKHVPQVEVNGQEVKVTVGSVLHPMTEAHLIQWIALETKEGVQIKHLTHEQAPVATFALSSGDAPVAAYEYCNLHGLWKKDI